MIAFDAPAPRTISADDAAVAVPVLSTNDALEILEETLAVVGGQSPLSDLRNHA